MKKNLSLVVSLLLVTSAAVLAQQSGGHRANEGRIPPAPTAHSDSISTREYERLPDGSADNRQHVNNDHWFGHDIRSDARFQLSTPWAHGHFQLAGAKSQFRIGGIDAATHRFWFTGGAYFEVATWEWPLDADWCWNCADDYLVYEDPDHPSWYLLYNTDTGLYLHVQYLGTH